MNNFKKTLLKVYKENSCENLIYIINFLPKLGGFPLLSDKFNVLFWVVHITLFLYVYIVGTVAYQMHSAEGFIDAITSFFNIYVLILIVITTWWQLEKRKDLYEILTLVKENDHLAVSSGRYLDKHENLLKKIKIIVALCYLLHLVNDVFIFIPSRTLSLDNFSTASCVGLEPLSQFPNRQICMAILAIQELTASVAVGSYDVIVLFLFSHTSSMFLLLHEEMQGFEKIASSFDGTAEMSSYIAKYLRHIVIRHSLVLHTVKKLQDIYSACIGVDFGLYAICLCIFFVLPFDVSMNFIPLIFHCLLIFFLYCFQGQRLTTASEMFETAVYCSGWQSLRVKEQKYIILMLKVSQRPVILYAAGVIPIRIDTFANILKAIYKFVTVFKV